MFGPGGFVWLLPFSIETFATARTDLQTYILQPQTLTTKDGVVITAKMGCVWQLEDVEMFLLQIADDEQAMYTQCYCALAEMIQEATIEEILTEKWRDKLWNRVKSRAKRYGVKMVQFELVEFAVTNHTIRLYNETKRDEVYFGA